MSAGKRSAWASWYGPRSPDCQEARRWDEMRATHRGRGKERRRSCDRSRFSWLDVSFPDAAAVRTSLTRDVLQNNPPCQDVEFNFAVRNRLKDSCSTRVWKRSRNKPQQEQNIEGESRERSGQARAS